MDLESGKAVEIEEDDQNDDEAVPGPEMTNTEVISLCHQLEAVIIQKMDENVPVGLSKMLHIIG